MVPLNLLWTFEIDRCWWDDNSEMIILKDLCISENSTLYLKKNYCYVIFRQMELLSVIMSDTQAILNTRL